ncbi:YwmB family TATA-box binding protein, partial [Clostridium sp.]|uniref:YwmB family TATA-box binding protein n=1 Tax=Clostridium sp. TaxID=1506 RepID=UPI003463A00C
ALLSTSFIINEERFLTGVVTLLSGQVVEKAMRIEVNNVEDKEGKELVENLNQYKDSKNIDLDIVDEFLESKGKIYINMGIKDNDTKLYQINDNILNLINTEYKNINTYYFIRGKLEDKEPKTYEKKLQLFLQLIGSNNVKTINNKEVYGTALTGFFNSEIIANEKVDLNFSINKYTSGTYVNIGTPIITFSY